MCTRTCAVLFLFLKLQTCYGNYDCFKLLSGKEICFMFEDTFERTFEESKNFCQNNTGFLLEIYDSEMQGLVERFLKSKTTYLIAAWLNLNRINTNTWVWGGQSGNELTYSNWGTGNPSSIGINQTVMYPNYKWANAYYRHQALTICIRGSRDLYLPKISITITRSISSAILVGIGVGLGILVLVIVSSLLVAKFVFYKKIPLPCKSAGSRLSEPSHQSGNDVISEVYESVDEMNTYGMNFMKSAPTYENDLHDGDNTSTFHYASLSQPETDSSYYEALKNRGEI